MMPETMISARTRQQLRRPAVAAGAVVGLVIIVAAAAAPLLTPYDLEWADLSAVLTPPTAAHPLGGDGAGRDVLSRLLFGARASLVGAVIGASFSLAIGVVTGLLAGYFGRRVDVVLGWVFNLVMALPAIIVVLAYVAVAGPGMTGTMLLVGGLLSPIVFRIVRGATHRVRSEAYVDAARVSGLSELRIVRRHVLRVIGPVVIVQAPLLFGVMLLVQAGIDYIGLGDAGAPSWGAMLNDASVNVLRAPLLSLWPGAAIAITVLAVTLVGNAVRDGLEAAVVTAPRRRTTPAAGARSGQQGTALLTIDDLAITHATPNGEVTVVDGVSLEIRRGEVLGLVGESGSGKSQTVLAALGLLPASGRVSGGQVWFDGVELTGASERTRNAIRGRRIGYVSQEPMSNLDPSFRVGSQLMEPLRVHLGLNKRQARAKVLQLLASVGINDPERVFRLYPHEISGGMAQRVLIAGAVSCDPELLIADEPTTALDVTVQAEVLDLLRTMRLEREMAILLVTHDLAVVADICDRATVLRGGAVVESAPVTALFAAPEQDYTAALLAADPHNAAGTAVPLALHEPLLEIDRLRVAYPGKGWRGTPHVVLEQVSLAVDAGETLGLVGESGSGKTTLGRAVLGLVPVSGGDIRHGGRSIAHLTRAERRAGVRDIQAVFQDPFSSLNPAMRIQDILVEPLLVDRDITKARAATKVRDLLDRVRLPAGIGERRAAELSGGQRQRVAIARALALDPRLIVCDEPVSALDVSTQAQVLELLAEIQRDTGVAYLFISHDLAVVRQISHRVAVMARGDIVESGDALQVTTQPHHEYTRRLLLSAPVPDPARQAERRAARLATISSRRETG